MTRQLSRTVLDQANIRPPVRWSHSNQKESKTLRHYLVDLTPGGRRDCQSIPSHNKTGKRGNRGNGKTFSRYPFPLGDFLYSLVLLFSYSPVPLFPSSPVLIQAESQTPATVSALCSPAHTAPDMVHSSPRVRSQNQAQGYRQTATRARLCRSQSDRFPGQVRV